MAELKTSYKTGTFWGTHIFSVFALFICLLTVQNTFRMIEIGKWENYGAVPLEVKYFIVFMALVAVAPTMAWNVLRYLGKRAGVEITTETITETKTEKVIETSNAPAVNDAKDGSAHDATGKP